MTIDERTAAQVKALLGRTPRGLAAVPVRDADGNPVVIRVASLVDGKPFPTLFWLVDAALNYRIDRAEASGLIAHLQQRIDGDSEMQLRMQADHRRHIALRDSFIDDDLRAQLDSLSFSDVLRQRGIGGIADFSRIRCLHTWYAAHLVEANTVGELLDAHWAAVPTA